MARASAYDKFDKKVRKWSGTIGAIIAILGALSGIYGWITAQFTNAVTTQIEAFREEVKASDKAQNQAITRLELMSLIQNDPDNIVAIEKMAKYYFGELDGDQYMTKTFSDWAREYGGDASIVIGGK